MRAWWILGLVLASCAPKTSGVGTVRFYPQPVVWRVNDRIPQAQEPTKSRFRANLNKVDNALVRRMTDAMELHDSKRVADVNAIDEVPDSTWFTNRIGIRDLSLDELRRGPNVDPSPFDHRPWTILGAKVGGKELGFTFEDALHRKFLLKFDPVAYPEQETATHIIVQRILWAIGYNVPQDALGYVKRRDLVISAEARKKGLDDAKLDAALKTVATRPDGAIRVLTSLFVSGTPIGPSAREGVRSDDQNDLIPHELRRSVRGQYPIFAWLDHADIKPDNTLDSFADGYVTHYLVDFGKALGVMAVTDEDITTGHESQYDVAELVKNAFTFGLRVRPWEGKTRTGLRGVGLFDAAHFDPGHWNPFQFYSPFFETDRFDGFWGAKLVMRFSPEALRAIVDEAKLSDPRAAEYLVTTLIQRQRATARYWFDRVAPLDAFRLDGKRLCFSDLTLQYQLRTTPTMYAIEAFDKAGRATGFKTSTAAGAGGQTCTAVEQAGDYTIFRVGVNRAGKMMPPVVVHVARLSDGRIEVVGLRRR